MIPASYRNVLTRRYFMLGAAAAMSASTIAGCREGGDGEPDSYIFRQPGIFLDAREMSVTDAVANIMIPETDTPGAGASDAAAFVDGILDGWALPETRTEVRAVLAWLDREALTRHARAFLALQPEAQVAVVTDLDARAFSLAGPVLPEEIRKGYEALKGAVYRGYYLSEAGATLELQYDPVPGTFRGCVPLAEIGRAWAT